MSGEESRYAVCHWLLLGLCPCSRRVPSDNPSFLYPFIHDLTTLPSSGFYMIATQMSSVNLGFCLGSSLLVPPGVVLIHVRPREREAKETASATLFSTYTALTRISVLPTICSLPPQGIVLYLSRVLADCGTKHICAPFHDN